MKIKLRLFLIMFVLLSGISASSQIMVFDMPLQGNVYTYVEQLFNKGIVIKSDIGSEKPKFDDNRGIFSAKAEFMGKEVRILIDYTPGTKKIYRLRFQDWNYKGRDDIDANNKAAIQRYNTIEGVFTRKYGQPTLLDNTRYIDGKRWSIIDPNTNVIIGYVKIYRYDYTGHGNAVICISFEYAEEFDPRYDF